MNNLVAYKSKVCEERVLALYDRMLLGWLVACESKFVKINLGKTHGVISGCERAKALILLRGEGGNAWRWRWNVQALATYFRAYAVDIVGEPGKIERVSPKYASGGHILSFEQPERVSEEDSIFFDLEGQGYDQEGAS